MGAFLSAGKGCGCVWTKLRADADKVGRSDWEPGTPGSTHYSKLGVTTSLLAV